MSTEHDIADINAMLEEIAALHRLHAAAPALLKALQDALRWLLGINIAKAHGGQDMIDRARAAIALTEPPKEP